MLARIGDALLPVPINRTTVNRFFGLEFSDSEARRFPGAEAEPIEPI